MSRYHAIFSWHRVTRGVSCKEAHSLCRILENAREELGAALAPRDGCRENPPIVLFGPACAEKSNPVYHRGEDGAEGLGRGVLPWLRGCRETRPGVPNSLSLCRESVAGVPLGGEPGRGEPPGMPSGRTSSREMPPSVPFSWEPGRGMAPGVQRAAAGVVQPPAFLGVDRSRTVQQPAFLGVGGPCVVQPPAILGLSD